MNVLVTGGGGYLGAILVPKLLIRGHRVRVLDIGYFGLDHLRLSRPAIEVVREDLRTVCADRALLEKSLAGCEAVIHLAAISNDPSAEVDPRLTHEVNFESTRTLALAAKARGMRFLFSSSCSIYGALDEVADEDAALHPLTTYATSKVDSERFLVENTTAQWRPVVLRNGTLYGYSPRMRFDLVVNIFSYCAALYNEIRIFGDGGQWRPFLHVADCARAFVHFLESPSPRHSVYNIAHENLRVIELYDIFRDINPACRAVHVEMANPDSRNYRVSTRRMAEEGFAPRIDVRRGAEEIIEAIVSGRVADPEALFYRNAKWLKELTQIGHGDHRQLLDMIEAMGAAKTSPRA